MEKNYMIPAKYVIKQSGAPGNACIKNQASPVFEEGMYPAYSASGQDVWLPYFDYESPGIVISAVGARCGKTFLASGKYAVCANTHVLLIDTEKCHPNYLQYVLNDESWWDKGGAAQPFVKVKESLNKKIFLPELEKQKRIVSFLDSKCSYIDYILEQTRASIEEYKKLKQAVVTQSVTKGVHPNRQMKDSGIEWLGEIPDSWFVYRMANLYDERNENGQEYLPILTVSINTGISDHEVADDEQIRNFVRSEDRTKYKRVYVGDLAYNMMRAWQGAFGAVRVDGMVSPAYIVAKPKDEKIIDSRYMEALLRTPSAVEEMHRYSRGITDFRLRLYWPEFKNIKVCLPSYEEQREIADYIDAKTANIDNIIAEKEKLLVEMEKYKKAIIYEYVTGKKEVPT